jgi:hypothetical protein
MEITRQNYEMFLLDYIEGNLPENMVSAILEFLKNNPDIEAEIKEISENVFTPEFVLFNQKEILKKTPESDIPGISQFEQLSVSFLEKEISSHDLSLLNNFIEKDERKRQEHELIQRTKLNADSSETYKYKNKLKHINAGIWLSKYKTYFAVAASVILIFGFSLLLSKNNQTGYGKAIVYKNNDFKLRKTISIQLANNESNIVKTNPNLNFVTSDSVYKREKNELASITNKTITQIDFPENNKLLIIADIYPYQQPNRNYNDDADYMTIQAFVNKKFKEKVLKQDKNEKVTFISVVNAFGRFTKKVFNRKIEMEKTTTEDGTRLYALKTDTYNMYTIKNPKEKQETNKNRKD